MLPAIVVVYVGDGQRAMDVGQVLDSRFGRPVHLLRTTPDELETLLRDDRPDCVMAGVALSSDGLQEVVDAVVDARATALPVFDLSGEVAMVPDAVDVHHLYPGTDPTEAADTLIGALLDASLPPAETHDGGAAPAIAHRGLDAYFAVDEDWTVTDWDPRLADWLGAPPGETVGDSLWTVVPGEGEGESDPVGAGEATAESVAPEGAEADAVTTDRSDDATETVSGFLHEVQASGDPATAEVYRAADDVWLELRALPRPGGGLECYARNVTEAKRLEAELAETSERLENTLDRITDAFFALDNEERIDFLNTRAEYVLDVDADRAMGERFWDVFPAADSTTFYQEFTEAMGTQEPTSFQEYYRPLDATVEVTAYPSEDGLSVFLRDVTDRVELQRKLEGLHDVTQELIVAQSDAEIGAEAVEAAVEVLDLPVTAIWRFDRTREVLEPLDWSEAVGERVEALESITQESGTAWSVYEESEPRVRESDPINTPTSHHPGDVGSEMLVPLGEFGVMGTFADEPRAFEETDRELFRVLGTAVESALTRARRERQLARRNERLNDFASVVSNDLRNPLQIAAARTEIAMETGDVDHLEKVDSSLARMEDLIADLLDRARGDQDLDRSGLSLATVARDAWDGVDTAEASLEVAADATLNADPQRLTQLFENLYRNAVEHAGPDVTVSVGPSEDGFYVGDDGPGIPEGQREAALEQGVSGAADGTGYGLAIVTDIVQGHGWSIEVGETDAGGARFDIGHIYSLESHT